MSESELLLRARLLEFATSELQKADPGHDGTHAQRVLHNALQLIDGIECDRRVVVAAATLHDLADHKFFDRQLAVAAIEEKLTEWHYDQEQINHVLHIILNMSFTSEMSRSEAEPTNEFCVVQDADRLDALGAIGIARAFSYGGHKNRPFYSDEKPSTIAHFYEKLLLLPALMKTGRGREIAEERVVFMKLFLKRFDDECHLK